MENEELKNVICLTGPMAAGKNAAAAILEKSGFISIDADVTVHEILAEAAFQKKVLEAFSPFAAKAGINLENPDGSLNRRNLGAVIFKDKKLLKMQEDLILPEVNKRLESFIAENPDKKILLNATVLYKIPVIQKCGKIIFVTAPILTRLRRAKKRDGIKLRQILARFWSQRKLLKSYQKTGIPVHVVQNTGSISELEQKLAPCVFDI